MMAIRAFETAYQKGSICMKKIWSESNLRKKSPSGLEGSHQLVGVFCLFDSLDGAIFAMHYNLPVIIVSNIECMHSSHQFCLKKLGWLLTVFCSYSPLSFVWDDMLCMCIWGHMLTIRMYVAWLLKHTGEKVAINYLFGLFLT